MLDISTFVPCSSGAEDKAVFLFHLCLGNFVGQFGMCTASFRYLGLTVFVSTVLRESGGTFRCSPGVGDQLLLLPGL